MRELQAYSARVVRRFIRTIPSGRWAAIDYLDDDGFGAKNLPIRAAWRRRGDVLEVDFDGSAAQVRGPLNTNLAVTTSAVFYVIACLVGRAIPANRGMMDPIRIRAPLGSIVNCRFPAAVAGGNVETSQRIVDVLLRALAPALPRRIPAASAGSMTNVALGGYDPVRLRHFAYYETVAGGAGAGPRGSGASAVQTHMTNTLNTPVEVLEAYYPLRVTRYAIRRGSGGNGRHRGGDGVDREIEVLGEAEATLLAERRSREPPGLAGGEPGAPGLDALTTRGGTGRIPGKVRVDLAPGDRIRVRTPGGGGWGRSDRASPSRLRRRAGPPSRARRDVARSERDDA
jgi:N-methylhydantoinase B